MEPPPPQFNHQAPPDPRPPDMIAFVLRRIFKSGGRNTAILFILSELVEMLRVGGGHIANKAPPLTKPPPINPDGTLTAMSLQ